MRIGPITSDSASGIAELRNLFADADREMSLLYPDVPARRLPVEALLNERSVILGAWDGGMLVGCGAARLLGQASEHHEQNQGEIKRVFVAELHRRQGIATEMLLALEAHLAGHDCNVVKLVTGTRQPGAIDLYRRLGYLFCEPYGGYVGDELSVFMEKGFRSDP